MYSRFEDDDEIIRESYGLVEEGMVAKAKKGLAYAGQGVSNVLGLSNPNNTTASQAGDNAMKNHYLKKIQLAQKKLADYIQKCYADLQEDVKNNPNAEDILIAFQQDVQKLANGEKISDAPSLDSNKNEGTMKPENTNKGRAIRELLDEKEKLVKDREKYKKDPHRYETELGEIGDLIRANRNKLRQLGFTQ